MVGSFCLMCTMLLILFTIENGTGTNFKKCPGSCMCLGKSVDCSHKGLSSLPIDMPTWVHELNLNNNRIHGLDKGILNSLIHLEDLKLNRNKIDHLSKDIFKHQRQLKTLELNRNHLGQISPLSFQSLEKLSILRLKRNNIRTLLDGAFFGLNKINTLELDYNNISAVSRSWVYGLTHLEELSLSNNIISQIDTDVWDCCKNLIDLNLSANQLGAVHKSTFKHLSKLARLNLNKNNISHIEEGAFFNTPNLKVLWLNDNKLSWTVEDVNRAFIGLHYLEKFHLASNQIKSINKNAFTELKNITSLDLSNNNITTVQEDAFSDMINLKELYLNTSNLLCDCNLQWYAEWLRKNSFTKTYAACAYPLWLRDKNIENVPLSNFTCDDVPKPRIIDEPKMKMALKGENISLLCKAVSSSPGAMTFVWKRDNIELHDVVVITEVTSSPKAGYTEQTSELKLFNVGQSEQGKYQCVVTNSFGTTYSQKFRISVLIFPKFSKEPVNITVNAGNTARLECAAHGEPQPQIAWQKDGGNDFPAARERRMHVMPTDDVFFIVNVKVVDMGVYSCTAQNLAGIIVANATLSVLEMPSFVKPMENKEIVAGNPIVLECMASGSPKPMLTWLKDGGPVKATERHFFTAEDQLMIIVGTTLTDAGKYECIMNNSLGSARGISELIVIPGPTMLEDDMMGIIIITVVCCAVGTSVVWVVIIYQTRKRIHAPIPPPPPSPPPSSVAAATATAVGQLPVGIVQHHQHSMNNFQVDVDTDMDVDEEDTRVYVDNTSEHSSCKDSGTGDSAKHSTISDNVILLSNTEKNGTSQQQYHPQVQIQQAMTSASQPQPTPIVSVPPAVSRTSSPSQSQSTCSVPVTLSSENESCVVSSSNIHAPLLHVQYTYSRSTNHDRPRTRAQTHEPDSL